MLHANDIVARNPEPLAPQDAPDTPSTSEMSSGKGKQCFKVEIEVESGSEDEDSMKEKALLVRFINHVVNYRQLIIDFSRLRLRKSGREGT